MVWQDASRSERQPGGLKTKCQSLPHPRRFFLFILTTIALMISEPSFFLTVNGISPSMDGGPGIRFNFSPTHRRLGRWSDKQGVSFIFQVYEPKGLPPSLFPPPMDEFGLCCIVFFPFKFLPPTLLVPKILPA